MLNKVKVPTQNTIWISGETGRHSLQSRKSKQLCRQVAETLDLVLSDSVDDVLRDLHVVYVEPAPYSSRLLVTLLTDAGCDAPDLRVILERLHAHAGRLRCEVAASIHRRRTPVLLFRVIVGSRSQELVQEPT